VLRSFLRYISNQEDILLLKVVVLRITDIIALYIFEVGSTRDKKGDERNETTVRPKKEEQFDTINS
jgi:hypothetical protein